MSTGYTGRGVQLSPGFEACVAVGGVRRCSATLLDGLSNRRGPGGARHPKRWLRIVPASIGLARREHIRSNRVQAAYPVKPDNRELPKGSAALDCGMTRAVGYVRASTALQTATLDAQRERIEAWAVREGVELIAVFIDAGVSGTAPIAKRPALSDALVALETHGAEVLVCTSRDRLARSALDAALLDREVSQLGARVLCADGGAANADTDEGRLVRTILDAVAEFEAARTRARTAAVLRHKRAMGQRTGGKVPFGFRADGKRLVPHDGEQATIARITAMADAGHSQRRIAAELDAEGTAGKRWHATTIARLLARSEAA